MNFSRYKNCFRSKY